MKRRAGAKKKTWIAALGAVVLVLILAQLLYDSSDGYRYQKYRRQAMESYQRGDYDSALSQLRRASAIESSEECLMLMADCYEAQENWDMALEVLRRMDRNDAAVTSRIAALEQRRSQQEQSEKRMVAGQSYEPDTAELTLNGQALGDGVLQEIRQLHALTKLSLADNQLRDLRPLEDLGGLGVLDLSGNRITDLTPLKKLANLRNLSLDRNPLGDLSPLYELKELSELSLRGVELAQEDLDALSAALPGCAVLSDGDREDCLLLRLGGVCFDCSAEELNLSGLGLRDIRCLRFCTQVKWLDLCDNQISDLSPLMNLQRLEQLKISGNQVSDLRALMGMENLRRIEAARNALTETTTVGSISGLTLLDLSDNPIEDFSGLKKLGDLQTLRLENTGIGDEDLPFLYELSHLGSLALDRNEGITDEAMSVLRASLPGCKVSYSKLVYPVELGGLQFRSDETSLNIVGTELADLGGFEKFDRLETVVLSQNCIENISVLKYSRSRESILSLDLSFNRIEDISAISVLRTLETLDLTGNRIHSLQALKSMTNLKVLRLNGNPLTAEQVEELQTALPDCDISF